MKKSSIKGVAIGSVVAGVTGYVTGLLTAPKSGKETRKDIKDAGIKAKAEAEKKLKTLHSELDKLVNEAKSKVKGLSKNAANELSKSIKNAQSAKDKAKGLLSSLHEGDTGDEDLQKAIAEVSKASTHLKKYLGKYVEQAKSQK